MRRGLPLFLVCWLFSLFGPTIASNAAGVPAQARALHTLADLGTNVDSFCEALVESAENAAGDASADTALLGGMSDLDRARWLSALRGACDPERARERHISAFALGYDAEAAREVTNWLTSETGRRILAVEKRAQDTDWDAEVTPFIDQLTSEPVPVPRVALFERLDAAAQATEDAAELQTAVMELMTYAAIPLLPVDARPTPADIDANLTAMRLQLTSRMRGQQSIVYLFVYRDTTDQDLEAYVAFAETDAGRWLFAHHRLAMLQLVGELRESIQHRLAPR